MKFAKKLAVAAALAATSMFASASFTLTFEGVGDLNPVGNYYNGGAGGNLGVSFSSDALGLVDSSAGGSGNTGNDPSGITTLLFLANTAVLNYAAGFQDGFSFYYATPNTAGYVSVYSELDKGGSLLGTIQLPIIGTAPGGSTYDLWAIGSLSLAAGVTAKSIDFGGTPNFIVFDNVTFGSVNPNPVPEPSTYALILGGLAGVAAIARRRKASV